MKWNYLVLGVLFLALSVTAVPVELTEFTADEVKWEGPVDNAWSVLAANLNASEAQEAENRLHMIALQSGAPFWNSSDLNFVVNALVDVTPRGRERSLSARGLASGGNPLYSDRLASWIAFWSPAMCEALSEEYGSGGANCG